jgi:hypothetical protein
MQQGVSTRSNKYEQPEYKPIGEDSLNMIFSFNLNKKVKIFH